MIFGLSAVLVSGSAGSRFLYAAQAISISGDYTLSRFDSISKTDTQKVNATFTVIISDTAWQITSTNITNAEDWETLVFDGTNTFAFSPANAVKWRDLPKLGGLVFVSISPSQFYEGLVQSPVAIYVPWLAYGVSPATLKPNKAGLFDIPPPWKLPRRYLTGYGYKWLFEATPDGRFLSNCKIVRDSSLDCPNERDEFLRPEFDCPTNLDDFIKQRSYLHTRKEKQDGFVDFAYFCEKYQNFGGFSIPWKVTMTNYYHRNDGSSTPLDDISLDATNFTTCEVAESLLPSRSGPVFVQDYRYKRVRNDRIYRYAEYVLDPSENWKTADDPGIVMQADDFLEHHQKFDNFGLAGIWYTLSPAGKSAVRCTIWVILLSPIGVFLIVRMRQRSNRSK